MPKLPMKCRFRLPCGQVNSDGYQGARVRRAQRSRPRGQAARGQGGALQPPLPGGHRPAGEHGRLVHGQKDIAGSTPWCASASSASECSEVGQQRGRRMSEQTASRRFHRKGPCEGPGRQRQDGQDRRRVRRGPREARALRQGPAAHQQAQGPRRAERCGVGDRVLSWRRVRCRRPSAGASSRSSSALETLGRSPASPRGWPARRLDDAENRRHRKS